MTNWLDWPFFEPRHRELAERLEQWAKATFHDAHASDVDYACRALVAEMGKAGFLNLCVADGGKAPDVRSLAIARATLARVHGLADFAFAMQGLGSGAISLFGSDAQKAEWLPRVAAGEAIAAYARPCTAMLRISLISHRSISLTKSTLDQPWSQRQPRSIWWKPSRPLLSS